MFGDCLSPEIVEEIIRCLTIDSAGSLWTFQLLKGLTRVRRFGVAIQFLEEPDRAGESSLPSCDAIVAHSWTSDPNDIRECKEGDRFSRKIMGIVIRLALCTISLPTLVTRHSKQRKSKKESKNAKTNDK